MALVSCPECNGEVSELAQSCPHCGHPLRPSDFQVWRVKRLEIGSAVCGVAACLCAVGLVFALIDGSRLTGGIVLYFVLFAVIFLISRIRLLSLKDKIDQRGR
ncbi:MAG: hypothetical protein K1Y02_10920 [Candidatus Hydrogenedentes bacterium]|nr:hypothetical protein [Candidatus Hydrogenedentota bacterium]